VKKAETQHGIFEKNQNTTFPHLDSYQLEEGKKYEKVQRDLNRSQWKPRSRCYIQGRIKWTRCPGQSRDHEAP